VFSWLTAFLILTNYEQLSNEKNRATHLLFFACWRKRISIALGKRCHTRATHFMVGWLIAFVLSFSGHYYLTFRDQAAPIARALKRFFAVSAVGFGINQGLYAIALYLQLRYDVALLGVLISVAILTYFLAKRWAFLNT
jgi:GtrA-like protein